STTGEGFGDSTGDPSEAGLTNDALYLYHWVKKHSRGNLICLWGHSLGSGSVSHNLLFCQCFCMLLQCTGYCNIFVQNFFHFFFQMYGFLPGFESLLWNIMKRTSIVFANDKKQSLISPLLILHAEDDNLVPYHMGLEVQLVLFLSIWTISSSGLCCFLAEYAVFVVSSCTRYHSRLRENSTQMHTLT
uniref:Uncharacterized protein n=1 Tax=Oreochromis aureus TaxID=47969 RepID=A0AAZ1X857_OREAU